MACIRPVVLPCWYDDEADPEPIAGEAVTLQDAAAEVRRSWGGRHPFTRAIEALAARLSSPQ